MKEPLKSRYKERLLDARTTVKTWVSNGLLRSASRGKLEKFTQLSRLHSFVLTPEHKEWEQQLEEAINEMDFETLERYLEEMPEIISSLIRQSYSNALLVLANYWREKLIHASEQRDFDRLKASLAHCPALIMDEVHVEYEQAKLLYSQIRRIVEFKKTIASMNNRFFAILRSYKRPPPVVIAVLQACYRLFGYPEKQVDTYTKIAILMQKLGKDSFKRRVQNFKISGQKSEYAVACHKILVGYGGFSFYQIWNRVK